MIEWRMAVSSLPSAVMAPGTWNLESPSSFILGIRNMERFENRRWMMILALIGLAIVVVSLAALAFAFWPAADLQMHAPLAPTLFISP